MCRWLKAGRQASPFPVLPHELHEPRPRTSHYELRLPTPNAQLSTLHWQLWPPHPHHICNTRTSSRLDRVVVTKRGGGDELRKMNRWIVGLMILALLAVGGVALATSGFAGRGAGNQASCPADDSGALCDADADGDRIVNAEDPDWVCPEDGSGCESGGGACLGLSADRPLDGSGARCAGAGIGQRVGGCRGGRF